MEEGCCLGGAGLKGVTKKRKKKSKKPKEVEAPEDTTKGTQTVSQA